MQRYGTAWEIPGARTDRSLEHLETAERSSSRCTKCYTDQIDRVRGGLDRSYGSRRSRIQQKTMHPSSRYPSRYRRKIGIFAA
jgi:hypothetical protein